MNCEELIVKRFLEVFNEKRGTSFDFEHCIKKDELPEFREKKTYDYHCKNLANEMEMGIEVKRLIPEHRERIINLGHRVKDIEKQLKDAITGDFLLVISPYKFRFKRAKTLKRAFIDVIAEVASVGASLPKGKLHNLSCYEGIGLQRLSESHSEFSLSFWPVSLASANQREISRALKNALKKFEVGIDEKRINIILLVELTGVLERAKINTMIKNLEAGIDEYEGKFGEKYNFRVMNGIYQIGIDKKALIAQVYPEQEEFRFYPDESRKDALLLYEHCLSYFLH